MTKAHLRRPSPRLPLILTVGFVLSLALAQASPARAQSENRARKVDQAALDSQEQAIVSIRAMLRKHRGTEKEPGLLIRLAEAQTQGGEIRFRIAHGHSHKKKSSLDLAQYKSALRGSVATLNELISRFPKSEEIDRAYFMRARANQEIGAKEDAKRDYRKLIASFPDSDGLMSAHMALAEYAIDENSHSVAVRHLKQVEKNKDDAHYPFALYKLSWAHYNLKEIPKGLGYLEKTIDFYERRGANADTALREAALMDVPLFYLEGFEQKLLQYRTSQAVDYFKELEDGPILQKMIGRYAKLLRSHDHESDLAALTQQVTARFPNRPESFELLVIAYEHQFNSRRFVELVATAGSIAATQKGNKTPELRKRSQDLFLGTADSLQKLIAKNKNATDVSKLNEALAGVYGAFTRIVDENDERIPMVRNNIAESLFETRQYDAATKHYLWIAAHAKGKEAKDASLRAIASRYEVLRSKGIVPKELASKSFKDTRTSGVDTQLVEWVGWVDAYSQKNKELPESFAFEANRCLYAQGAIFDAVKRSERLALEHPGSKHAQASATLVIDTYVASADWAGLHAAIERFSAVKDWENSEFSRKLATLSADTQYKKVETSFKSEEYKTALIQAESFMVANSGTARAEDALVLAGQSALALKDYGKAREYLSRLVSDSPRTEAGASALLSRAALHESTYSFAEAAQDYRAYLSLPTSVVKVEGSKRDALRRRTLAFAWIAGPEGDLPAFLASRDICSENLADECDRYRALSMLAARSPGSGRDLDTTTKAFYRARHSSKGSRSVWAALALEGARHLAFRDRNIALRVLESYWENLDGLSRSAILPAISVSVPRALSMSRKGIGDVAPLAPNERYVSYRMEIVKEFETAATRVSKLPFSRIKATALNEVANAYMSLASGLKRLKSRPELAELAPGIEAKGNQLRANAFQVASRYSIEEQDFDAVAKAYFAENPLEEKRLNTLRTSTRPRELDLVTISALDSSGGWDDLPRDCADAASPGSAGLCLKIRWKQALRSSSWPQVAYLLQEEKAKRLLPPQAGPLMTAVSFATMGAQGEGLLELDSSRRSLSSASSREAALYLMGHYLASLSQERTQRMLSEYGGGSSPTASSVATVAQQWLKHGSSSQDNPGG